MNAHDVATCDADPCLACDAYDLGFSAGSNAAFGTVLNRLSAVCAAGCGCVGCDFVRLVVDRVRRGGLWPTAPAKCAFGCRPEPQVDHAYHCPNALLEM